MVGLVADRGRHILLVQLPALCGDAYSLRVFARELAASYTGGDLGDDLLQYADYSAWQDEVLASPDAREDIRFWQARCGSGTAPLGPTRGAHGAEDGPLVPAIGPLGRIAELAPRLAAQAEEMGVDVGDILLAAWQVILAPRPDVGMGRSESGSTAGPSRNCTRPWGCLPGICP